MAMKGSGSLGRSSHLEVTRKPPIPAFSSTKPRAKSDASKSKENAAEQHKHDKGDKTSEDSNSDPGNPTTHINNKGETEHSDTRSSRLNSHSRENMHSIKTEPLKTSKGDTEKPEPKADSKKPKTIVIPSRYMNSKQSPRTSTPNLTSKPAPKPPTTTTTTTTATSTGLRAKTPERSAHTTTERHSKTPTKQPATPRLTTTSSTTSTTLSRSNTVVPKRTTPTPTTPTRAVPGRKTPVPTAKVSTIRDKHSDPQLSPKSAAMLKEDVVTQFNIKIASLQTQLKQLALERDSVLFQQNQSEGSEQSDWDESLSISVDGASENSSEQGDDRDEKYIEIVRRYKSTLSVLSQKIVILKTALTDAKSEYDALQTQHKQLLVAHQQSLSDLDKVKSSDVASIS